MPMPLPLFFAVARNAKRIVVSERAAAPRLSGRCRGVKISAEPVCTQKEEERQGFVYR
jgi:hypothetical protein